MALRFTKTGVPSSIDARTVIDKLNAVCAQTTGYFAQSTAALTLAEVDVLDGATAGVQVASKVVVADANVNTGVSKITELHIGATGAETQVTATGTEINVLDGALSSQNVVSKAAIFDANGKLNLPSLGSAAVSASGLLMGTGTTAAPAATAAADSKFLEFRTKSTATSGDSRGMWMRHDISGAGGSGECARFITDLTAAAATARGSQTSLQPDDTGYVTGLGVGTDSQILFGDAALAAGGTYAVINSELYSGGSSTDVGACTKLSSFRAVNGGDATGAATVDLKANYLEVTGFTAAADTTKTISSVSLAELPTGTIGLRVDVGGTLYRLPLVLQSEWN